MTLAQYRLTFTAMPHEPDMRRFATCNDVYDTFVSGAEFVCARCETLWGTSCEWFQPEGPYVAKPSSKRNGKATPSTSPR